MAYCLVKSEPSSWSWRPGPSRERQAQQCSRRPQERLPLIGAWPAERDLINAQGGDPDEVFDLIDERVQVVVAEAVEARARQRRIEGRVIGVGPAVVLGLARHTGCQVQYLLMLDSARLAVFEDVDLARTVGCIAHSRRLLLDLRGASTPEAPVRSSLRAVRAAP